MKESDKRRTTPNPTNPTKRPAKTEKKAGKPQQKSNSKGTQLKSKPDLPNLVSDSNTRSGACRVLNNVVIDYVDDVNRFEEEVVSPMVGPGSKDEMVAGENSSDLNRRVKPGKDDDESDLETVNDSVSSQGDSSLPTEDEKVDKDYRNDVNVSNRKSADSGSCGFRGGFGRDGSKFRSNVVKDADKNVSKSTKVPFSKENKDMRVPPKTSSESSEGVDDKPLEDTKETGVFDEASNGTQSVTSDNETLDAKENSEHEDEATLNQRIEEMEMRIEKLEEELREVAALEIALYSVVPEHGSSAHKVHTPARRLSRLYIHACKHWTQDKRGTIAKNTASGLVLIAKSCGNDVSRLTFWLSNTVVLREIISQAVGSSLHSTTLARIAEFKGSEKRNEGKSVSLKWNSSSGSKQVNGSTQFLDDWQETGTFITALEKVESWIFSRIVESVWWQALTPHMQPPTRDLSSNRTSGRLLRLASGDQQQGTFSINLWRNAFRDAFQRLCPVRAGGHECGCLPVIARMVMEQCVSRLDVAMFNAILRESAHEIPTDPVSDPIVDSRVLPITAGNLSFGSGAQLKNAVGNWSRWLTDMCGMDADESLKEDQHSSDGDDRHDGEPKSFNLLSNLSDLLMLPKDMLMDRSIRQEVCPSISLPLVKRILCNFTPDEFCPDPVQGAVLEALNAESIVERRLSADSAKTFPYLAAQVVYNPPSSSDVAEKVAEAGTRSQLSRNVSVVQRKGYTSDEELEELDCPLTSIIENLPSSPTIIANGSGNGKQERTGMVMTNARYELLREVWSA